MPRRWVEHVAVFHRRSNVAFVLLTMSTVRSCVSLQPSSRNENWIGSSFAAVDYAVQEEEPRPRFRLSLSLPSLVWLTLKGHSSSA